MQIKNRVKIPKNFTTSIIGMVATGPLVILAVLVIFVFIQDLMHIFPLLSTNKISLNHLLDITLLLLIVIELLKISAAYFKSENIIPTVFETALVAVLREIVVLGLDSLTLEKSVSLTLIMFSIGMTWFLIQRAESSQSVSILPNNVAKKTTTDKAA